jgi:translation initiation factor IF-3
MNPSRRVPNIELGGGDIATQETAVNEKIRAREVRVVDPDGKQIGIMSRDDALGLAREHELDLVEVAPRANPPVCRIMDYGKYKYQQSKKGQEAKKKQAVIQIKEVKVRPKTEEHDLQIKIRNARRFLEKGYKVKVSLMFRGREITHPELAFRVLERIAESIQDLGTVESQPKKEGRFMVMMLGAHSSSGPS